MTTANGNGSTVQATATDAKSLLAAGEKKKEKPGKSTKAVGVNIEELENSTRDRISYTEQIALKNPTALAEIVGNYYDDEEYDIRYWEGEVTVYLVRDGKETAIKVGMLTKQGFNMVVRDVKLLSIVDQIKKKWGYVEQVSKAVKKTAKRKLETSEGEAALMSLFNAKRG